MKITKQRLKQIIQEELESAISEAGFGFFNKGTLTTKPHEMTPEEEEDLSIEDLAEDIRDMIEGKSNDIIDDAELHNYLMEVIELLREDTHTLGQE
jgi:hypothetical protein